MLEVIGCDVDEAALHHRAVGRALIIQPQARLPFDDSSIDVVVADYVFEHIPVPAWLASEFGEYTQARWLDLRQNPDETQPRGRLPHG